MSSSEVYLFPEEDSLAMSKDDSFYLHDYIYDILHYEGVSLEPECSSLFEESFIPNGTAVSVPIENILRYFLVLGAKIESPYKVRDYLYRYPDMAKLARSVTEEVYSSFDFRTQLSLEIEDDEVPNSEYLVIYARVPEYDNSIMDRIRKIRESYYDLLNNTTGWFLLTTDFGPPR